MAPNFHPDDKAYQFAKWVTEECLDVGIDWADPESLINKRSIPVTYFLEYPVTPNIEIKKQAGDEGVAGCCVDYDIEGSGVWVPCLILSASKLFTILVAGYNHPTQVPRHRVLLLDEHPRQYAKSLHKALRDRERAETFLRYNVYVENMPTADLPPLTQWEISRILSSALNSKSLAKFGDGGLTNMLLEEVKTDHELTLNQIVLKTVLQDKKEQKDFALLDLSALDINKPKPPAPETGTIVVEPYSFASVLSEFQSKTLLSFKEVVHALCNVRSECSKVLELQLLVTEFKSSLSLTEFKRIQTDTVKYVVQTLKRNWIDGIRIGISTQLDGLKNELDLEVNDKKKFEESPLPVLLRQVRYVMEQSLRVLVEESASTYTNFIAELTDMDIEVLATDSVKITHKNKEEHLRERDPFFLVELKFEDGMFVYTTSPADFEREPVELFIEALVAVSDIPRADSYILKKLFLGRLMCLYSIGPEEEAMVTRIEFMKQRLQGVCSPLTEYLRLYDQYLEFLNMDLSEYVRSHEEKGLSLQEDKDEVRRLNDEKARIYESIPPSIRIGIFQVDCQGVKQQLQTKFDLLVRMILSLIAQKASELSKNIGSKFTDIHKKLLLHPESVEQIVEMEEYIKEVPKKTAEIHLVLVDMLSQFDVLENFSFQLSDEQFSDKWSAYAWPKTLEQTIGDASQKMEEKRDAFKNEQIAEQEAFVDKLDQMEAIIETYHQHNSLSNIDTIAPDVRAKAQTLKEFTELAKVFNQREVLFGLEPTNYERVHRMVKQFEPYTQLWISTDDWRSWKQAWLVDDFTSLQPETMDQEIQETWRNLLKASKALADYPDCQQIADEIRADIDDFKPLMPVIASLRNPGLKERHWEQMSSELGFELKLGKTLRNLQDVISLQLQHQQDKIVKICETAAKEYSIESALNKMQTEWEPVEFEIMAYRETGSFVLKGSDDIQQMLDDNIVMAQAMSFSPFKKPHAERLEAWAQKLNMMSEILEQWLNCQRNWMYLEPIFSSDDIMKQLPSEGQKFKACDRQWRKYMKMAADDPNALRFTDTPDLLGIFMQAYLTLEQVQKGLSDYLETKRQSFARFYFLSNEELLEILSQTKDPRAVQPHLRKCFEAVDRVTFEEDLAMTSMWSGEGENVVWDGKVYPEGNVEFWLTDVERMMRMSINTQIGYSVDDYAKESRPVWVLKWPGQIILACDQIYWTRETEEAIKKLQLKDYHEKCHQQLLDVTKLVRTDLSKMQRVSLGALVTLDVHGRDVVENLHKVGVQSTRDFEWSAQLRYYWEKSSEGFSGDYGSFVVQVENRFRYGCEYLGNSMRLVVTPLTDRIYLTLTGALGMALGGAPAGPAGTGKTETTKDLAKALAKQCIVFNCQEGMDYIMVGKFFKGLAMSGAWACFDEFNRINIEVLSVIAQQLLTINQAIVNKLERFVFEGVEISLNPENASFITMNPGYAGRTELPDNLKVLFRPVACMVPNYALIGEIRLFSFGFQDPRNLAEKMVNCFKLSSEQLSSQDHYDFGMRAVNTVISAAGLNKRSQPDADEGILMLRALKDSNLPKFLTDDIVLFSGIISDLFPGVKLPDPDYGSLMEQMKLTTEEMGLQCVPNFMTKAIQFYDVTVLRHGLMTVGPTGGGKTCCKNMLAKALTVLKKNQDEYYEVRQLVMNPKSITMGQLYGSFDEATHEWSDGILCKLFREAVYDTSEKQKWVVFDGPVDALWIESMNTVLDENKKLCLVSGEIITMTSWMRMVFEVEDLSVASPATVSRVGIIYVEPSSSVGTAAMVTSWLQTLPEAVRPMEKQLKGLFDQFLDDALDFHRRNLSSFVQTVEPNLWRSVLNVLDGFLREYHVMEGQQVDQERLEALKTNVEPIFLFSIIWGIGGALDSPSKLKFDQWLRGKKNFPAKKTVFDYAYDTQQCKWKGWMETVEQAPIDPRKSFSELIVQTPESVSYAFMIEHICSQMKHVLCIGPTGTGKTLVVKQKLMKGMDPSVYSPIFVTFSAQTSANQTQDILDGKFDKRRKGVFGPPAGKKFTIFVDDTNMPLREQYFAQPPIELLRQWMDHGGWYDRKTHQFSQIIDVMFVGAMGPPGGGRQPVTNRFLRHFNHISFPDMNDDSLRLIFRTIFAAHLETFFPAKMKSVLDPICEASLDLYNNCLKSLLPTPAKSHYTFNLRDLAKIFQGIMMAESKKIGEDEGMMVRLWVHECTRILRDRLTDAPDREWFDDLIVDLVKTTFTKDWMKIRVCERCIWGDYMTPGADPRLYAEVQDLALLRRTMEGYLEEYNVLTNKPMKLVLFLDAIEHVSRISRILRQPRSNALLLGVGGSGRQSLTRVAAFCASMDCTQIEIAKGYGKNEWREDLKKILLRAGKEGKPTVFLFTDTQIVMESFLEDLNNILNSGEVPNIFDMADQDQIMMAIRSICQAEGIPLTKQNMYERFLVRIQANLHLVLAFSPVGNSFRNRLRQFPSLVTCCTIDWFTEWPAEALRGVASESFAEIEFPSQPVKDGIISICRDIHQGVEEASHRYAEEMRRYNYVTPSSYLELLTTFKKVLKEKQEEIGTAKRRLSVGLDKLISTEKDVETMKQDLIELRPILEKTTLETEELMVTIEKDKISAAETKAVVEVEEAAAAKKAAECKEIKDSAEAGLAEALPALDEAVACLKNLKLSDIGEVAKYSNPPVLVKLVLESLCVMFQIAPTKVGEAGKKVDDYWPPGKKLLGDAKGLLDKMFDYDKDHIPDKVIKKIEPFMVNPDFEPDKISSVSKACTAMCQWTRAMYTYHEVALQVEPKRIALAKAEEELKIVEGKLNVLQAQLKEVMDRLAHLDEKFQESMHKKEELANKAEDCRIKMDRADRLLGGLGGEKVRWSETVVKFSSMMDNVIGDVVVASGGIAYLGAFVASYREEQERFWSEKLQEYGILFTAGAGVRSTLADPVQIRAWNISGLPTDVSSIENAIILSKSRRWSLMIDPQGQANKWIKNMQKGKGLEVIKLSEKEFLRTLTNAVRFGKPVLLENVGEELDPSLEPILAKQIFVLGGVEMIKIGDETLEYNPDFSFFITSKLPNPHYSPETCVKVTLLNFTVNQSGLEDQILGIVVGKERPDLQEAKNQLVISMAEMRKTQKELEDKILKLLAESEGDILADENLIVILGEAKVTSDEITVKVAEAEKTEKEIDETRGKYRPTAFRGSILFFCVADLAAVDSMYQYSLQWFLQLFELGLDNSPPAEDIAERCRNVNDFFTFSLYKNICRGLFEKDKLLFSFILCMKIMQGNDRIDAAELRFLLAGATSNEPHIANPAKEWLVESSWNDVSDLSKLPNFQEFDIQFCAQVPEWKAFFDSNTCYKDPLPGKWESSLSTFQKLLVLRCLRQDKIQDAIMRFVTEEMGEKFIEPPPFNLPLAFDDSLSTIPLIFILSTGADPTMALLSFAQNKGFSERLESISLGQGQGPIAEKKLTASTKSGSWLLLQNCHLAVSWMPRMEAIVDGFDANSIHPDFRLWLTAMPSPQFPVAVLQNAVKMTLEPPKGLKANMTGSFQNFSDEFFESCQKPDVFKKLVFSICWFHAVMQERRKFGPLGWNISYDFSNSDRDICLGQLQIFLDKYEEVPYKVIFQLSGDVNYGGRVTDDWDRRTMNTLLAGYICPAALQDGYQFSADPSYCQPPASSYSSYIECLQSWPLQPSPEAFGLHENADITCAQNEVRALFENVLALQPRVSAGSGMSRDETIDMIAENLFNKLPNPWLLLDVQKQYPVMYEESMNTVLQQECIRYNNLLVTMKSTLSDVRKALKGLVVMSAELDALATSLFNNQVPAAWESKAYPSMKPLALWQEDLHRRCAFIQLWIDEGIPMTFWISGFFFPQAFLTAILQNFARKQQIGIDTISLDFVNQTVEHTSIQEKPADGAIVWGLFLEGCRWDISQNSLVESRPKELFTSYVPILLQPVQHRPKPDPATTLMCPCYKILTRKGVLSTTGHSTNFVTTIEVPTSTAPEHWVKRGVALFLALAY